MESPIMKEISMEAKIIHTDMAPISSSPVSQAWVCGGLVFTAGFAASDPKTGKIVPGGIEKQTRRVIQSLEAVLNSAGSGLEKVIKVNVYLKNIEDKPGFDQVYRETFSDNPPARRCVSICDIEPDALLEMDAVAYI
jgi:2-iminobutanoate/2-iminopropanoate deaminase